MKRIPLLCLAALICSCFGVYGDEIRGSALLQPTNCPVSGLVVEVDPQIGSTQPKVVTTTAQDGTFVVRVSAGRYLIVIYQQGTKVFQAETQVSGTVNLPVSLTASASSGSAPCNQSNAPQKAQKSENLQHPAVPGNFNLKSSKTHDTRPVDLALDTDGSFLIADLDGKVNRIFKTDNGLDSEPIFTTDPSDQPQSVASDDHRIYVTTKWVGGCILYVYDKTSKVHIKKDIGRNKCSGIAADGNKVYVMIDNLQTLDLLDVVKFAVESSISVPQIRGPSTLAIDNRTSEIYLGDSDGHLYLVSPGKHAHLLPGDWEEVHSIGVGANTILVASEEGVMCLDKRNVKARPQKGCVQPKIQGDFTGVRVDASESAWFLDEKHDELRGPYAIK